MEPKQSSDLNYENTFFRLPRELRDFVYELVVLTDTSANSYSERTDIMTRGGAPSCLAHVSQKIRTESLPIFLKKKFRATVNMFDTTGIQRWFDLFGKHDTQDVDLTTTWLRAPQDGSSCLDRKSNLLNLMESGFEGRSHVFPPRTGRNWTRYPQEPGTSTIYLEMFYALDTRRYMKFHELAKLVSILRRKDLGLLDVKEVMRVAVDLSDVWQ